MVNYNQWKQCECPSREVFLTFKQGIERKGYSMLMKDLYIRKGGSYVFYYKEVPKEYSWGTRLVYKGKPCIFLKYSDCKQCATIVPEDAPWTKVVSTRELSEEE